MNSMEKIWGAFSTISKPNSRPFLSDRIDSEIECLFTRKDRFDFSVEDCRLSLDSLFLLEKHAMLYFFPIFLQRAYEDSTLMKEKGSGYCQDMLFFLNLGDGKSVASQYVRKYFSYFSLDQRKAIILFCDLLSAQKEWSYLYENDIVELREQWSELVAC
jgi:hypothetical protein